MNKEFLAQQKQVLEKLLSHLEGDLNLVKAEDSPYAAKFPEYGGEPELNDQEVDEYEKNLAMEGSVLKRIDATKKAFKKIDEGTYEACSNCKKSIGRDRLTVVPEALYCTDCQSKQD